MFVEIDNKDMDVFKVEEWINETRDANGGVISPEFAMDILKKTNHFAHIKKVLKNITKACSDENGELVADKVLAYKEFILSCVDGREMSPQALEMLQEMADVCEVRDEFDEKNAKPKEYDKDDCKVVVVKSKEEFEALEGNDLRIFFDADEVDLTWCDLDKVKKIRFRDGAVVDLSGAKNLPKVLDLSMCSKVDMFMCDLEGLKLKFRDGAEVNLRYAENLPKDLDLSMCSKVNLEWCNLEGLKLKFREGAEVSLKSAKNLPQDLDVSMCSKVDMFMCDLEGLKLKFRDGAEVNLRYAKNLPKDLDLSMCSKVNLGWCNLEGLKLKFREGAEVDLSGAKNLPKDLDLSMCDKVDLHGCDLSRVEKIKFREEAEVDLKGAKNLPKELDLSMCSKVNLTDCDLSGVEKIKIKFKNKAQKEKFMKKAKNFSGKVEYDNIFTRIRDKFGTKEI